MKKTPIILLVLALLPFATQADVIIVASKMANFSTLSKDDISAIYHGKIKKLADGRPLKALDQDDNATRAQFLKTYLAQSGTQYNTYWSRITFTGKGLPPENVRNDAGVIDALQTKPNAIGYIDSKSLTDNVKKIRVQE